MVRLQIGQEKVKESVEVERQKLQDLADEVCSSVRLHTVWGCVLSSALNRIHRCTTNDCSRRGSPSCLIHCRRKRRWTDSLS